MVEDNTNQEASEQTPVTPSTDESQNTDSNVQHSIPYDRFQQVNNKKKELQEKLDTLEQAEQERVKAKAIADGNYQKVIDDLTPQAERAIELETELQAYQDRDQAELNAELETIDEKMRDLVIAAGNPSMQLAWIRNAKRHGLFDKPSPPQNDSGTTGDPKNPQVDESDATRNVRQHAANMGFDVKKRP